MHYETGILILVFVVFALIIGAATRHLFKPTRVPYTVALLVIGLGLGAADRYWPVESYFPAVSETFELVAEIDPHLILFIFLPTLIFESAYSLEVHLFKRIFNQIAILAVPGLILTTLATAAFVQLVFPWDWGWALALVFGALISATDPVAVVALLKEVSSRKRLETLIEGESLLNDGTAIVLFTLFMGLAAIDMAGLVSVDHADSATNLMSFVGQFLWVVLLGLMIGLVVGWLALFWIDRTFNDPLIEIGISIAAAYLVFFVAEGIFHVSGVVAVVAMAILFASVGRTRISPEVSGFVHQFWEVMAYVANTLIFLLVGILIAKRLTIDNQYLWLYVLILYAALLLIRAGTIALLMPILKRVSIGINRDKAIVLTWGGLRGAVALALALSVVQSEFVSPEIGNQILFLCAGVVVLSIVVNGMTMEMVLHRLGLDQLPPAKQATVERAESSIQQELNQFVPVLEQDQFLQEADWKSIKHALGIFDQAKPPAGPVLEEPLEIEDIDLAVAFRRRLLETERKHYWTQFREGIIGREATAKLVESAEHALDGFPTITPRPELHRLWKVPPFIRWIKQKHVFKGVAVRLSFQRMMLGYDVARGFINAQREISNFVATLSPSEQEAQKVRQDIDNNMAQTVERIDELKQSFPEVIHALESNAALRLLLKKKRMVIHKLVDKAVLDKPEAAKLITEIELQMAQVQHAGASYELPDPAQVIRQANWIENLSEQTVEKLIEQAEQRIFSPGELIFKQGEATCAFVIVLRGRAEVTHKEKGKSPLTHIVEPGGVIGGLSLLTGKSECTARAMVLLDVLWLPEEKLKPLMAKDIHLATNIMKYLSEVSE